MTAIFDPLLVPATRPRPAAGSRRSQHRTGPGRPRRSAGPERRAFDGRRGFVAVPPASGARRQVQPHPARGRADASTVARREASVIEISTTRTRASRTVTRSRPRPVRARAVVLVAVGAFLLSFGAVTAVVETSVGASNTSLPADAPEFVVAKPGDTIWAIARRIMPEGNINGLVAELVRLNGATINAGQQVRIP